MWYPGLKVFIFPGNGDCGFESKRPWEALSCGCLLLFHAPEDVENGGITEYSMKHLWEKSIFKFRNYNDLKDICNQLYNDKDYKKCINKGILYELHLLLSLVFDGSGGLSALKFSWNSKKESFKHW